MRTLFLACTLLLAGRAFAQSEMDVLYQKDRDGEDITKLDWNSIQQRDAAHRQRVRELLDAGALKTGQDFKKAAFIFNTERSPMTSSSPTFWRWSP
jgi:hypothetical protein